MELFHGTDVASAEDIRKKIDLSKSSSENLDFGPGFYTSKSRSGTEKWAKRKAIARNSKPAIVVIDFDYDKAVSDGVIKEFENDLRWGQFIINNRNGYEYIEKISNKEHNLDKKYNIVAGRIADYDIWNVIKELSKSGEEMTSIDNILNPFYSYQYSFHTELGLSYISETKDIIYL